MVFIKLTHLIKLSNKIFNIKIIHYKKCLVYRKSKYFLLKKFKKKNIPKLATLTTEKCAKISNK